MDLKLKMGLEMAPLPLSHQEMLREKWNERVTDPLAFIPHELKGKISRRRAREANEALGQFAADHLKSVLARSTDEDRLRRLFGAKKIVALGCGRGYDSEWLSDAVRAGLETWWLDVSDTACEFITNSLRSQWREIEALGVKHPKFQVKRAEIRTTLLEPEGVELDLDDVEVWFCCRTLGCLSIPTANVVLGKMGQSLCEENDPAKKNCIVIVAAMRDRNPNRVYKTSKLYRLGELLSKIKKGGHRAIEVKGEATTSYFDQIYSALTIGAK